MLYFDVRITGKFSSAKASCFESSESEEGDEKVFAQDFLRQLCLVSVGSQEAWLFDNSDYLLCPSETDNRTYIRFFGAFCPSGLSCKQVAGMLVDNIAKLSGVSKRSLRCGDFAEISSGDYIRLLGEAGDIFSGTNGSHGRSCFANCSFLSHHNVFSWTDTIVPEVKWTKNDALEALKELRLPDPGLAEEVERIYSSPADPRIRQHPAHYFIAAADLPSAVSTVKYLVKALFSAGRLISRRVATLQNASSYSSFNDDDNELATFMDVQNFSSLMMEYYGFSGEEAESSMADSASARVSSKRVYHLIDRYSPSTLFFIVCMSTSAKARKLQSFFEEMSAHLNLVRLSCGYADRSAAEEYIRLLADKSGFGRWAEDAAEFMRKDTRGLYTRFEVNEVFEKWARGKMVEEVYPAYRNVGATNRVRSEARRSREPSAFDRLNALIGLEPVKQTVRKITALSCIGRDRVKHGLARQRPNSHMVFTGNPGTAKTTVARLVADIFRQEGILSTGKFIECGRSDIIAKFVGWTAKRVTSIFDEAEGGVLFIDEAYSLVDDNGGGYAQEAVDTIVQEMENRRDRVIVVFAGYPGPMRRFLESNAGLRSRIAFHLEFPDYSEDELLEILRLQLKDKSMMADESVFEKCRGLIRAADRGENFGNGRFIRNLIEAAEFQQAVRLKEIYGRKRIPKTQLLTLAAEDFQLPESQKGGAGGYHIGFTG